MAQWNENNSKNFSKKKMLVWGQIDHLDPKITHPHNSGLNLRLLKSLHNECD